MKMRASPALVLIFASLFVGLSGAQFAIDPNNSLGISSNSHIEPYQGGFVVVENTGTVLLWNNTEFSIPQDSYVLNFNGIVATFALDEFGHFLVAVNDAETIEVTDLRMTGTNRTTDSLNVIAEQIRFMALSPQGDLVVLSSHNGDSEHRVDQYQITPTGSISHVHTNPGLTGRPTDLAYSSSRDLFFIGVANEGIYTYDASNGNSLPGVAGANGDPQIVVTNQGYFYTDDNLIRAMNYNHQEMSSWTVNVVDRFEGSDTLLAIQEGGQLQFYGGLDHQHRGTTPLPFNPNGLAVNDELVGAVNSGGGQVHVLRSDLDGDGIPDSSDDDIDGDGFSNAVEQLDGSDPYNNNSLPRDSDLDGNPDVLDDDDDNDGLLDTVEVGLGTNERLASTVAQPWAGPSDVFPERPTGIDEIKVRMHLVTNGTFPTQVWIVSKTLLTTYQPILMATEQTAPIESVVPDDLNLVPDLQIVYYNITYEALVGGNFSVGEEIDFFFQVSFYEGDYDEDCRGLEPLPACPELAVIGGPSDTEEIKISSSVILRSELTPETVVVMVGAGLLAALMIVLGLTRSMKRGAVAFHLHREVYHVERIVRDQDSVRQLIFRNKKGYSVVLLYFTGLFGLLVLAGELLVNPFQGSSVSAGLAFFALVPVIFASPLFFILMALKRKQDWKLRLPLLQIAVCSLGMIAASQSGSPAVFFIFAFGLLFFFPMFFYGNLMGTSWNFMIFNFTKGVRDGFDHLKAEHLSGFKRLLQFFLLVNFVLFPLLAANNVHAVVNDLVEEENTLEEGGFLGQAMAELLFRFGDNIYIHIIARLVALLILMNVTITGILFLNKMIQLQMFGGGSISGRLAYQFERQEVLKADLDRQLDLIFFIFFGFFGYSITLLLVGVYAQFAFILPPIPNISQEVTLVFVRVITFLSNAIFLLFWLISISKFRKPWGLNFHTLEDEEQRNAPAPLPDVPLEQLLLMPAGVQPLETDNLGAGVDLMNAGRYQDALAVFNQALDKDPSNALAWGHKGTAHLLSGDNRKAIASAEKSLGLNRDLVIFWNVKGVALARMGRWEEANSCFHQALEIDPNSDLAAEITNNLGLAELENEKYDRALEIFASALTKDPSNAVCRFNQARVYYRMGHPPQALAAFEEALKADPSLKAAWMERGNLLAEQGRFADAIHCYQQVFEEEFTKVGFNSHGNIGRALLRSGNAQGAQQYLQRRYQSQPELDPKEQAKLLSDIGVARSSTGDFAGAEAMFTTAISLNKKDAELWYNRGRLRLQQHHWKHAIKDLKQALDRSPDHLRAWLTLGLAHQTRRGLIAGLRRKSRTIRCYQAVAKRNAALLENVAHVRQGTHKENLKAVKLVAIASLVASIVFSSQLANDGGSFIVGGGVCFLSTTPLLLWLYLRAESKLARTYYKLFRKEYEPFFITDYDHVKARYTVGGNDLN